MNLLTPKPIPPPIQVQIHTACGRSWSDHKYRKFGELICEEQHDASTTPARTTDPAPRRTDIRQNWFTESGKTYRRDGCVLREVRPNESDHL